MSYYQALAGSSTDWVGALVQQSNQAANTFGVAQSTYMGSRYPRLSGTAMRDLFQYWKKAVTDDDRVWRVKNTLPDSAHITKWLRDVANFTSAETGYMAAAATAESSRVLVPEVLTNPFWEQLHLIVTPLKALDETPTTWSIAWDAVKEATKELADKIVKAAQGTVSFMEALKWIVIGGAVIYGLSIYDKRSK